MGDYLPMVTVVLCHECNSGCLEDEMIRVHDEPDGPGHLYCATCASELCACPEYLMKMHREALARRRGRE